MKIKSRLAISLALISLATALGVSVNAQKLYSLDGRTIDIPFDKVDAYCQVGWYKEPPVALYAPDGRTITVLQSEVFAWTAVGWFTEPFEEMEAPDGRTITVPKSQVTAWENVGWYQKNPTIYCFNLSQKIARSDYAWFAERGWSKNKAPITSTPGFSYATFELNSAGGVEIGLLLRNISDKTMKYVTLSFRYYNAVGDPAYDTISNSSYKTVRITGPIDPNETFGISDILGYVPTCSRIVIENIKCEYMDSSISPYDEWCGMVIKKFPETPDWSSLDAYMKPLYWDGTVVDKTGTIIS